MFTEIFMRNAHMEESTIGVKINNLQYAADTTLLMENKEMFLAVF